MNRIPTRVDRTRSVTTATPFHVPPTRRPSETPRAQLAKPKARLPGRPTAWSARVDETDAPARRCGRSAPRVDPFKRYDGRHRARDRRERCRRRGRRSGPAGGRPSIARRFHSVAKAVSVFGSNLAPRSLRPLDLLLVGRPVRVRVAGSASVRLACGLASEERRSRVHCAVRDPGWPILASDRAIRFRRISRDYRDVKAIQTSHQDARRQLLFEAAAYELLVADAGDVDGWLALRAPPLDRAARRRRSSR